MNRLQPARVHGEGGAATVAPPVVDEVLRSSGQPLDAQARGFMESRFGYDFGGVRVHTDDRAARSADAVDARAYTVGESIAFAEGEYSPHTSKGRRLLAHELAHVVQQSASPGSVPALQRQAKSARTFPGVKLKDCDEGPFRSTHVRDNAEIAFNTARDCGLIKSESLRSDILSAFDGLTIRCYPEAVKGSCAEAMKGDELIKLYKQSLDASYCPSELAATIFHEAVHLAEPRTRGEGTLAYDCSEACFPGLDQLKRGDPSRCDFERAMQWISGVSGGAAITGKGSATGYIRVFRGLEKRGPLLSILYPTLGIGLTFIGETASGEPGAIASDRSVLVSLFGRLRVDPGKAGGPYFSVEGGPELALTKDGPEIGVQLGAKLGWRVRTYDISLNAGAEYDPTRQAGDKWMYMFGATFQFGPKLRGN